MERKEVNGGCCLVAWEKVNRPIDLGGLGIHNLEVMGWALQMRWLWFKKTRPARPWAVLEIPVHTNSLAMFAISVVTSIGEGLGKHLILVRSVATWLFSGRAST